MFAEPTPRNITIIFISNSLDIQVTLTTRRTHSDSYLMF